MPVHEKIDPSVASQQGYQLVITSGEVLIFARDPAGQFYARQTLRQLRRQFPSGLPCLEIRDYPDFPVRGVMLDVSRDKVPTMATLYRLIDMLAEWKINHLQLYIEHTFAYRGHEEVWRDASPLTPQEIRDLDHYCRERFIELVPNQNSFGHMERWLKHPRVSSASRGARWRRYAVGIPVEGAVQSVSDGAEVSGAVGRFVFATFAQLHERPVQRRVR